MLLEWLTSRRPCKGSVKAGVKVMCRLGSKKCRPGGCVLKVRQRPDKGRIAEVKARWLYTAGHVKVE